MIELNENGWLTRVKPQSSVHQIDVFLNVKFADKKLFKNAYAKVKKAISTNDAKSAKQIIAVLKKDQRHAINFAPNDEDTLLYL